MLSGGEARVSLLSQMVELKHIEGGAARQSSWPRWLPYVLSDQKTQKEDWQRQIRPPKSHLEGPIIPPRTQLLKVHGHRNIATMKELVLRL